MNNTLDAFIRRASRIAETTFNERGEIPMFWLLEKANGEQVVMVTPVDVDEDDDAGPLKDVIAHAVREFCHEHDVQRFVHIAEYWTLEASTKGRSYEDAQEEMLRFGSLANHPQRREIVLLCADDGREHVTASRNVIRPNEGKPYLEKLSSVERSDRIEGRFLDLLPRRDAGSA